VDEQPGRPEAASDQARIQTFLIADVRGWTLFTQQRGDEAAAKLAAKFARVARETVQARGGQVIELRGDEALAVFSSARQAVAAAVDLQERFVDETIDDPELPMPVGIGLDAGEAVAVEGGYRGGALNLAARLCGQAGPGEILASRGVTHLARHVDGVRYVDRGKVHLKNLTEPVELVRIRPEGTDPAERLRTALPSPPSRRRSRVRIALAAALALVVAIVVPATIAVRGGGSDEPIAGDALARLDLESGELQGFVPLESRPGAVATGEGSVWVTLPDRGAVIEIDAEKMSIIDTVPVGANPVGIAAGADSVWVANGGSSTVSRISPATNEVVDDIVVPGVPGAIAMNAERVWVTDSVGDAVTPIVPETGDVLAPVAVGDQPVDVADDGDDLWVANAASGSVSRVVGGDEVVPVDVGEGPQAIAVGPDGIYVANSLDGTVSRIDRQTASTDTFHVGEDPTDLAFAGGFLWVSVGSAGLVKRIDPQSGAVTTIRLGSYAGGITVGDGSLWVSVRGETSAHRGGTLTVLGSDPFPEVLIEPALAYTPLPWGILALTNDGLVGYRRVGGPEGTALVPNLARSIPDPTDGGRTYTFQLRPGIRYSSGDPVMPGDFRRAIERFRLLNPDLDLFNTIDGATECRVGSCDLSAGIETDDDAGTVTFHLVEPDPDFVNKLAMPFAFAVPAETPETPVGTTPIPATGPYRIERYSLGETVILVRNTEFRQWSAARPDGFPDQIVFRLDPEGSDQVKNEEVDDILEGRADLMWNSPPADRLAVLETTRAGQLHMDPSGSTAFMFLNTQIPPFADERVRRALNFAIDRGMIVDDVFGGTARVTCQILPPAFPGYEPYCPYTSQPGSTWTAPDPEQAQQLLDASGATGTRVTVWAASNAVGGFGVPIGQRFVNLLDELGFDASLKVVESGRFFRAVYGDPPLVQTAYFAWGSDFLAESGFIPGLTCATTGSSKFCDPSIQRRIERATNMQLTDPAGSHQLWTELEHDLVDRAPWVPLGSAVWVSLVSQRLDNYQFHPYWGHLYEQMWVR